MERVAFLVEDTGERFGCLLNPESLVLRRTAGVRPRRTLGSQITGSGRSDDALIYTGGGRTELVLDLLFDVSIAGSSMQVQDIRDLTGPLWRLSENFRSTEGTSSLRVVRFVWGKSWNVPGVITAVAERLEYFSTDGTARRSWLRMRFVRLEADDMPSPPAPPASGLLPASAERVPGLPHPDGAPTLQITSGGAATGPDAFEIGRPDHWAFLCWREPAFWRRLAAYNGLDNPLHVRTGTVLAIPSATGAAPES